MSTQQHTGAARRTPWEVVFGETVFVDEQFPAIRREIEARGSGGADPGAFVMLAATGTLLRALRPAGDDDAAADAPDAVLRYGALAWHGFQFDAHGRPLFTLADDLLEHLVARSGIGAWAFEAPAPAGYVQLPRHRVWTRTDGASTPEPVDGFFWTCLGEPPRRLDLMLCTGVRPGRPGIGVIDLAAPLPPPAPGHWGDLDARDEGDDFANVLPGGELDSLYALTNAAEVLKLVSRIFRHATTQPDAVGEPVTAPPDAAAVGQHMMPPSALPARPIRMDTA